MFINVYKPYEDDDSRSKEFVVLVSFLDDLIEQYSDSQVILGGDISVALIAIVFILTTFHSFVTTVIYALHETTIVDFIYHFHLSQFSI